MKSSARGSHKNALSDCLRDFYGIRVDDYWNLCHFSASKNLSKSPSRTLSGWDDLIPVLWSLTI